MDDGYAITPIDEHEPRETDSEWSIDPYFSGPEAGNNPDRHRGLDAFDRIKTPAERATMVPPELRDDRRAVV